MNWATMSSDLFGYEGYHFTHHSSLELAVPFSGGDDHHLQFFSDSFSPFSDSAIDILQEITDHQTKQEQNQDTNPIEKDETHFLDKFSLPNDQLESLSIYNQNTAHVQLQANGQNFIDGFGNFSDLEVKYEEFQMGFDSFDHVSEEPHHNLPQIFMQRSCSDSFDEKPARFLFKPRFDSLTESLSFQNQSLMSPDNNSFCGQMRRVCSTGDLQNLGTEITSKRSSSSPLVTEGSFSFMEETNSKVGRYSVEERKQRISKYKAKRTQRNFNKTIKYACRKTLADSRPRIRGRFARNDEILGTPEVACSARGGEEDHDEIWVEGFRSSENDETTRRAGQFVNVYDTSQFQHYGFPS